MTIHHDEARKVYGLKDEFKIRPRISTPPNNGRVLREFTEHNCKHCNTQTVWQYRCHTQCWQCGSYNCVKQNIS